MAKSKRLQYLRDLAACVERLCHRAGVSEWLHELELVAESQERQHRAMGKRVCGATYRASVRDAVCYFVCKTILEELTGPVTWSSVAAVRRDYALGQACRERAVLAGLSTELSALESRWRELAIEYSDDIAGRS